MAGAALASFVRSVRGLRGLQGPLGSAKSAGPWALKAPGVGGPPCPPRSSRPYGPACSAWPSCRCGSLLHPPLPRERGGLGQRGPVLRHERSAHPAWHPYVAPPRSPALPPAPAEPSPNPLAGAPPASRHRRLGGLRAHGGRGRGALGAAAGRAAGGGDGGRRGLGRRGRGVGLRTLGPGVRAARPARGRPAHLPHHGARLQLQDGHRLLAPAAGGGRVRLPALCAVCLRPQVAGHRTGRPGGQHLLQPPHHRVARPGGMRRGGVQLHHGHHPGGLSGVAARPLRGLGAGEPRDRDPRGPGLLLVGGCEARRPRLWPHLARHPDPHDHGARVRVVLCGHAGPRGAVCPHAHGPRAAGGVLPVPGHQRRGAPWVLRAPGSLRGGLAGLHAAVHPGQRGRRRHGGHGLRAVRDLGGRVGPGGDRPRSCSTTAPWATSSSLPSSTARTRRTSTPWPAAPAPPSRPSTSSTSMPTPASPGPPGLPGLRAPAPPPTTCARAARPWPASTA